MNSVVVMTYTRGTIQSAEIDTLKGAFEKAGISFVPVAVTPNSPMKPEFNLYSTPPQAR